MALEQPLQYPAGKLRSSLAEVAIATLLCACWVFYQTPAVEHLVGSPDAGFALSGGAQILTTGEQPYIDYFIDYGPLYSYVSAAAQWAARSRLIGEIALAGVAFTIIYVCLFFIARTLAGSRIVAAVLTATALFFVPTKFFSIYLFVAGPVLVLLCVRHYLRTGGLRSLALLALSITICGLIRHDYGVYAFAAAWTALFMSRPAGVTLSRATLRLVALVLLFALPWLVIVGLSDHPLSYFEIVGRGTFSKSAQFGLPHPLLSWTDLDLSLLYSIFFLWPPAGLGLLALQRSFSQRRDVSRDAALPAATCVIGLMTLLVATYRADFAHLLYVIPTSLLSLAALYGRARKIGPMGKPLAGVLAAVGVTVPIVLAISSHRSPEARELSAVGRSLSLMSLPKDEMIDRLATADDGPSLARLFASLRDCTSSRERILVFPFFPQSYYFSGRPFGGKIMAAAPGYFSDLDFQNRQIESLRRDPPVIVLWHTTMIFDHDPKRAPTRTHAQVFEYLVTSLKREPDLGPFAVFVPEPGSKLDARNVASCVAQRAVQSS